MSPLRLSRAFWRDAYIGMVLIAAVADLGIALTHPTSDAWTWPAVLALLLAMVVTERLSVPLPRSGAVSITTIPHVVAMLLLPVWLTMSIAGTALLLDQLAARTGVRRTSFNLASTMLTVGMSAQVADWVGLDSATLGRPDQWQQVLQFLLVAATYYVVTNLVVSVVAALSSGLPIRQTLFDNARFALPAEFAVCGIGALVAVLWTLSPPWVPIILFPGVISQVALTYISTSRRAAEQL